MEAHLHENGVYSRYLWQNKAQDRKMGSNEYGCADAANIKYILGIFDSDPAVRKACVDERHMLFGAVCALAELQLALKEEIQTDYPLKPVLDRRPFI